MSCTATLLADSPPITASGCVHVKGSADRSGLSTVFVAPKAQEWGMGGGVGALGSLGLWFWLKGQERQTSAHQPPRMHLSGTQQRKTAGRLERMRFPATASRFRPLAAVRRVSILVTGEASAGRGRHRRRRGVKLR